MSRINPPLVLAFKDRMACNEHTIFKNPNLMGVVLYLKHAFARRVRHAVVIARNRDHALVADTALHCQNSIIRDCRKRLKAGLFFGKRLIDNAQSGRMGARIGNACPPEIELRIQIVDIPERPRQKEVLPDIAEGSFNLAFCLGPVRLTRAWDRAVVVEQTSRRKSVTAV